MTLEFEVVRDVAADFRVGPVAGFGRERCKCVIVTVVVDRAVFHDGIAACSYEMLRLWDAVEGVRYKWK